MRPIPIGASAAMVFSLLVAFIVTPWASLRLLKRDSSQDHRHDEKAGRRAVYRRVMGRADSRAPLALYLSALASPYSSWARSSLVAFKFVRVKMLPFDNKSEFQVIVDMPEGTTLEATAAVTREIGDYIRSVPEVD